jgi:LysM repeat protein
LKSSLTRLGRAPLLCVALLILAQTGGIPPIRPPVTHAQGSTNLVLAFYYAWYSPNSFGPGKTPFQPPTPYYSTDAAVIQRHVNQAQGAGINGFVQSWYGPAPNQTDSNFATLLNIAAANGFLAAVDFEVGSPYFSANSDRIAALNALLDGHARHSAYLRVDGRPVVFFWANWLLSVSDWSAIREQVDPGRNSIWIAEGARTEYLSVFDGLHLYNTAWSNAPAATATSWSGLTREAAQTYGAFKYWVATAMPGFNDSLLGRGDNAVIRHRNEGTYYQSSFAGAASSRPDMLIINSFNEWAEGSNIEPSIEFGNLYLDLTGQLSAAYKSGAIPQVEIQSNPGPATAAQSEIATPGPLPIQTMSQALAQVLTTQPTPTAYPDGRIVYLVQPGDTLIGIAFRYQVQLADLYELNGLNENSLLTLGQEIVLGLVIDQPAADSTRQMTFPGATILEDGTAVYTVKEGDTLIKIAVDYDLTLPEILELNPDLAETTVLSVGQGVVVGQIPTPQEVGGSADMPTPIPPATDTPTPTAQPTEASAVAPSPTTLAVAQVGTPGAEDSPTPVTSAQSGRALDVGLVPMFIGIVVLLAAAGLAFLYLGRQR